MASASSGGPGLNAGLNAELNTELHNLRAALSSRGIETQGKPTTPTTTTTATPEPARAHELPPAYVAAAAARYKKPLNSPSHAPNLPSAAEAGGGATWHDPRHVEGSAHVESRHVEANALQPMAA